MLVAVESSGAKGDHLAAWIADRKHQTPTETIVTFVSVVNHKSAAFFFFEILAGVLLAEHVLERLP